MEAEVLRIIEACFDIPENEIIQRPEEKLLGSKYNKSQVEFSVFVMECCERYDIEYSRFFDCFIDSSYKGLLETLRACMRKYNAESCNAG